MKEREREMKTPIKKEKDTKKEAINDKREGPVKGEEDKMTRHSSQGRRGTVTRYHLNEKMFLRATIPTETG